MSLQSLTDFFRVERSLELLISLRTVRYRKGAIRLTGKIKRKWGIARDKFSSRATITASLRRRFYFLETALRGGDLSHRFRPRGTRSISSRFHFSFATIPCQCSSRTLTDRPGEVSRVMFSALESHASAYIGWQTRPFKSGTPIETSSHSLRPMKCEEYSVFGPRSPTRNRTILSVRYCEGRWS